MAFTRKSLNVTFQLGKGTFGSSGFDTVKLEGLRCSAHITAGDSVATAELELRVHGVSQSIMNQLTILNQDYAQRLSKGLNFVTVEAGSQDEGMNLVFAGGISEAWADFASTPDSSFYVQATTALVDRYLPGTPTSFSGAVDIATVMQTIAAKMDPPRRFRNDGVEGVLLRNVYLHGSMYDQMQDARRMGDVNAIIDEATGSLVIWPRNAARGGTIPLISKDTGLVGYPSFTQFGVQATTLYNPSIAPGGKVKVESVLETATGTFYVYLVGHDLESETPGGKWFTHFEGSIASQERPV